MRTIFQHPKTGFRFSRTDLVILALAIGSSLILWGTQVELSLLVLFVVLHFFLFCNVFRIRRNRELIWTAIFLSQFMLVQSLDFSWRWSFGFQIPVTMILLFLETGHESYHGVALFSRLKSRDT